MKRIGLPFLILAIFWLGISVLSFSRPLQNRFISLAWTRVLSLISGAEIGFIESIEFEPSENPVQTGIAWLRSHRIPISKIVFRRNAQMSEGLAEASGELTWVYHPSTNRLLNVDFSGKFKILKTNLAGHIKVGTSFNEVRALLRLQEGVVDALYAKSGFTAHIRAPSLEFATNFADKPFNFSIQKPDILIKSYKFDQLDIKATANHLEALLGNNYFSSGVPNLKVMATLNLSDFLPTSFKSDFYTDQFKWLESKGRRTGDAHEWELDWRMIELSLDTARRIIRETINQEWIEDWSDLTGAIHANGHLQFHTNPWSLTHYSAQGIARDINLKWQNARVALSDFEAPFTLEKNGILKATMQARGLDVLGFRGSLAQTPVSISLTHGEIELPEGFKFTPDTGHFLMDPVHGTLWPDFSIHTGIHWKSNDLVGLARGVCLKKPLPNGDWYLDLKDIWIDKDGLDSTGTLTAHLLSGTLQVENPEIYDWDTEVPELRFSSEIKGVRLDELGKFIGFGEMDGLFNAYARNVVFEAWLPTRFASEFRVDPHKERDVVFSPEAMKNFVRIFAGQDLSQLPGIADWLAFGWPSRVFGGYDVDYAGIAVTSENGVIMVETLDPPHVLAQKKGHFILNGPRFKMPLVSPHYPLIVDATSMGNFVVHMLSQLDLISQSGAQAEKNQDDCIPSPRPR